MQKLKSPSTEHFRDKGNSIAHTLWLTSDLCKVQCRNTTAMSAKHQRQTKTKQKAEPIEKCRSQNGLRKEMSFMLWVCCARWTFPASRTCELYFSPRGLLRSWLPCAINSWSLQPLSMKGTQGRAKDQLRGSDDSQRLPPMEASSKTCKQTTGLKYRLKKIQRSKTHLIRPIRALASSIHPQCFVHVLFHPFVYNSDQHDCTGRGLGLTAAAVARADHYNMVMWQFFFHRVMLTSNLRGRGMQCSGGIPLPLASRKESCKWSLHVSSHMRRLGIIWQSRPTVQL